MKPLGGISLEVTGVGLVILWFVESLKNIINRLQPVGKCFDMVVTLKWMIIHRLCLNATSRFGCQI